ncbi:MAG: oxidoreductase family protein [Gammaproteobacteria bacterium]
MLTTRLDGFFDKARPENGATCTLAHGDLRGDNLFFCDTNPAYPQGWLCIDYQLMFRGPVPSDLAHVMNSGTVLPEVYAPDSHAKILRAFYDRFMTRTQRYPDYSFRQFVDEYTMMSTVQHISYIAYGGPIAQAGAFNNDLGMRVELGGKGATEADLPPEQRRQRMWWAKALANFAQTYATFAVVDRLRALPEDHAGLGPWVELPDHLLSAT